jgi:hypothetical protein
MLTVSTWYFKTRGGGGDLSTVGRVSENMLHSIIRCRTVCMAFSGQL